MKRYLTLKQLQVTEANVHAGFYSAGLPSMTAFAGLTHALSLRMADLARGLSVSAPSVSNPASSGQFEFADEPGDPPAPVEPPRVTGFMPVFRTYAMAPGPARRVNYEHGLSAKAGVAASDAFDPLADLVLDLVLECESLPAAELLGSELFQSQVQELRLSGGTLFWAGAFCVHDTLVNALNDDKGPGFVLEDACGVLAKEMEKNSGSVLDLMDRLVARPVRSEDDDLPYQPRYVAAGVGFRALEDAPTNRPNSRFGLPHRFVEPLVGLARVRLLAGAVKQLQRDQAPALLWRQLPPTPTGYYLVRADAAA